MVVVIIIDRVKKLNVIKATVPILDFYDAQTKAECDMNINNETGIRNSHLLHCYCSCMCLYIYVSPVKTYVITIKCLLHDP